MDAFVFGMFGLIIGSFLNVLIVRRGNEGLGGRSHCRSCNALIHWYDNIPVISWFVLGGRCRTCRARISLQYPLVEAVTGALFALIGGAPMPLIARVLFCASAALLTAIAVYDLREMLIPDSWAWAFAALALLTSVLFAPTNEGALTFAVLGGPAATAILFALWAASRGRWMGFGDVKLGLGIGWLLGPLYGTAAVFLAFVIGAAVGVPLVYLSSPSAKRIGAWFTPTSNSQGATQGFTMKSEIPFGPFLVLSCIIIWILLLYGIDPLAPLGF